MPDSMEMRTHMIINMGIMVSTGKRRMAVVREGRGKVTRLRELGAHCAWPSSGVLHFYKNT